MRSLAPAAAALTALTQLPTYAARKVAADRELYRIVFRTASRDPEVCELIASRLRAQFTLAKVVASRMIEDRLLRDTHLHGSDGQWVGTIIRTAMSWGALAGIVSTHHPRPPMPGA